MKILKSFYIVYMMLAAAFCLWAAVSYIDTLTNALPCTWNLFDIIITYAEG